MVSSTYLRAPTKDYSVTSSSYIRMWCLNEMRSISTLSLQANTKYTRTSPIPNNEYQPLHVTFSDVSFIVLRLLDADVPIISALSVRRFAPFDPYFIPLDGNTEDWTWLEHKVHCYKPCLRLAYPLLMMYLSIQIFDEKYEGPLRVKATGFEMALVSIEALKKAVNV